MKKFLPLTATAMILALAACGEAEKKNQETTAPAATEAAKEDTSEAVGMMEKATEMAKEKAAEVAEMLKLDTSSMDSFTSSLSAMKSSLSGDQASQLSSALASIAKGATSEKKSGLLGAAKDMASGKSIEETLYEAVGDQLNDMTFEDILKMAG